VPRVETIREWYALPGIGVKKNNAEIAVANVGRSDEPGYGGWNETVRS
jgi:hypothetical protein